MMLLLSLSLFMFFLIVGGDDEHEREVLSLLGRKEH